MPPIKNLCIHLTIAGLSGLTFLVPTNIKHSSSTQQFDDVNFIIDVDAESGCELDVKIKAVPQSLAGLVGYPAQALIEGASPPRRRVSHDVSLSEAGSQTISHEIVQQQKGQRGSLDGCATPEAAQYLAQNQVRQHGPHFGGEAPNVCDQAEELNTPQTQNEDDLRTTYLRSQWAKEVQELEAQIGIQALKLQEQAENLNVLRKEKEGHEHDAKQIERFCVDHGVTTSTGSIMDLITLVCKKNQDINEMQTSLEKYPNLSVNGKSDPGPKTIEHVFDRLLDTQCKKIKVLEAQIQSLQEQLTKEQQQDTTVGNAVAAKENLFQRVKTIENLVQRIKTIPPHDSQSTEIEKLSTRDSGPLSTTEVKPLSTIFSFRSAVHERAQEAAKSSLFVKPVLQKVRMEGARRDEPAGPTSTPAGRKAGREAVEAVNERQEGAYTSYVSWSREAVKRRGYGEDMRPRLGSS